MYYYSLVSWDNDGDMEEFLIHKSRFSKGNFQKMVEDAAAELRKPWGKDYAIDWGSFMDNNIAGKMCEMYGFKPLVTEWSYGHDETDIVSGENKFIPTITDALESIRKRLAQV